MKQRPKTVQFCIKDEAPADNQIKAGIGLIQSREGGGQFMGIILDTRLGKLVFDVEEAEGLTYALVELCKMIRSGVAPNRNLQ